MWWCGGGVVVAGKAGGRTVPSPRAGRPGVWQVCGVQVAGVVVRQAGGRHVCMLHVRRIVCHFLSVSGLFLL